MSGGGSSSGNGRRRTTRTSGEPTSGRAVAAAAKKLRDLQRRLKFRGCLAPSVFEAPFEEAAVESLYRDLAARFRLARQTLLAVWLAAVTAASAGLFVGGAALGSSAQHGLLWGAVGASGVLLFALWTCVEADRLARRLLWSGTQATPPRISPDLPRSPQISPDLPRPRGAECVFSSPNQRSRQGAYSAVSTVLVAPSAPSPRPEAPFLPRKQEPNLAIALALSGRTTDWDAVKRAATRLRHRDYGLRDYYVDVRQASLTLPRHFLDTS
ncbi:hypothetical protein EMIHUDRAFT_310504 [Emiliania huxleyi CCMP1516]|uniref:Uncharacterized protein n=2 Tax=Emiliania huxleyi TaxID=2903 RepID=A0A0D3JC30_EMIH1|nr:hypothetical protein EMIHUDRAFT_310504 [Emiliania huxleyi CCMP1516]EOD21065.1 hypothetical protein EMIHUDRAFT_310504 [Emiliania huxleyi CCMP1516]|eukprot:XP_005773494.1 hypothetical protein EMIHUDRAFT_310504 [Emiliania huxleyi CCMP1516]